MTIIFPDPMGSVHDYENDIQRLNAEIAATEKALAQLRRSRGCRTFQLRQLEPGHQLVQQLPIVSKKQVPTPWKWSFFSARLAGWTRRQGRNRLQ